MSQVRYQITLSVDGNHTVSVSGDDKEALKEGLVWAKGVYDKLAATKTSAASAQPQDSQMCAIHHSPMKWMVTGNGSFWSCHKKLDDGSYCPYKPPKEPRAYAVS
jgi:hypothetical protein